MGYFVTERLLRYEPPPRRLHPITTGATLDLSGPLMLRRPTAPTNERVWGLQAESDGTLRVGALDDALGLLDPALELRRSGAASHGVVARSATIDQPLAVNVSNASLGAYMGFRRSGQTRWTFGVNAETESGSNEGSNFAINAFSDNGSYLATPLSISRRWNIVSANAELHVTRAGGDLLHINAVQQGQYGTIAFKRNAVQRWSLGMTNATESGGNTGSHFEIGRFADNGAWISAPFAIERNTGRTIIRHGLTLENNTLLISNATGGHLVNMDVPSGEFALVSIYRSGVRRWAIGMNNTAESGGNTGSHFEIRRYDDSGGSAIDVPLSINRQTGVVTVTGQARGLVYVPNLTWTTIYTIPVGVTMGIIQCGLIGNSGGGSLLAYSVFAIWQRQPDNLCYLQVIWKGAACSLQISGQSIQYWQDSGGTQGVFYGVYELYR